MKEFISMDDFEALDEAVDKYELPNLFYSIDDIKKYIEPDIQNCLPFAIKLSKQKANTPMEKQARAYLLDVLNQTIIFD